MQLNFGAAKVTVIGETTVEDIEKAGAFDDIKVSEANRKDQFEKTPLFKQKQNQLTTLSLIFLIAGYATSFGFGDKSPITIGLFALAIIIGGHRMFIQGFKNLSTFTFDIKTLMNISPNIASINQT